MTGNPLDLAIQGPGFFKVRNGGNTYYTRNGAFTADENGFIRNILSPRFHAFPDAKPLRIFAGNALDFRSADEQGYCGQFGP